MLRDAIFPRCGHHWLKDSPAHSTHWSANCRNRGQALCAATRSKDGCIGRDRTQSSLSLRTFSFINQHLQNVTSQ